MSEATPGGNGQKKAVCDVRVGTLASVGDARGAVSGLSYQERSTQWQRPPRHIICICMPINSSPGADMGSRWVCFGKASENV